MAADVALGFREQWPLITPLLNHDQLCWSTDEG